MSRRRGRRCGLTPAALLLVVALTTCAPVPTRAPAVSVPTPTATQVVSTATATALPLPAWTATATPTWPPPTPTALATQTPTATPTTTPVPTAKRAYTPPPTVALSDMVHVPAGAFTMGSDEGAADERPVHVVSLDGFSIDVTEVTNAQFAQFLDELGNREEGGAAWLHVEDDASLIAERDGRFVPKDGYADHPVIEVSWYGAVAYCEWAARRLPTEAEWEKAARGTDGLTYPWGEGIDCDHANYGGCVRGTTAVGSHSPGASPYGALDMAGNVYEWVADWYEGRAYAASPSSNPTGPASGSYRSVRGGSWVNGEQRVRGAARFNNAPANPLNNVGFRCARSD